MTSRHDFLASWPNDVTEGLLQGQVGQRQMAQLPIDIAPRLPVWASIGWPSTAQRQPATLPAAKVDVHGVLASWRAAERRLANLLEASPMRTLVRAEVARLRAEYHQIFEERVRADGPAQAFPVYRWNGASD